MDSAVGWKVGATVEADATARLATRASIDMRETICLSQHMIAIDARTICACIFFALISFPP